MCTLRNLLFCLLIFSILENILCGDCNLRVESIAPIIRRNFGSRHYFQTYPDLYPASIPLANGETIDVFCEQNFRYRLHEYHNQEDVHDVKNITFQCTGNILQISSPDNLEQIDSNGIFSCNPLVMHLFESNATLSACDNYASYGIGAKPISEMNYATIGLCYDIDNLNIKYAKYLARENDVFFIQKNDKEIPKIVELNSELFSFNTLFGNSFISQESFNILYQIQQAENVLLKNHVFEYKSLLQDTKTGQRYENFEQLFKIIWSQDLRERNWRYFLNEFEKRYQKVTYLVQTGVSGVLKVPTEQSHKVLEIFEGTKNVKAPAYIWMYIKSLKDNTNEEYVIVGHNTPFLEISEFCDDICDEIDWLKNTLFQKLHLMPVYGLVNCCRLEDVAGKLDNFPIVKNSKLQFSENLISTERNDIE